MMGIIPATLERLLSTLDRELRDLYGERYRGLVLYGSYSRGEAEEGSDVDLLLLMDGTVSTGRGDTAYLLYYGTALATVGTCAFRDPGQRRGQTSSDLTHVNKSSVILKV